MESATMLFTLSLVEEPSHNPPSFIQLRTNKMSSWKEFTEAQASKNPKHVSIQQYGVAQVMTLLTLLQ